MRRGRRDDLWRLAFLIPLTGLRRWRPALRAGAGLGSRSGWGRCCSLGRVRFLVPLTGLFRWLSALCAGADLGLNYRLGCGDRRLRWRGLCRARDHRRADGQGLLHLGAARRGRWLRRAAGGNQYGGWIWLPHVYDDWIRSLSLPVSADACCSVWAIIRIPTGLKRAPRPSACSYSLTEQVVRVLDHLSHRLSHRARRLLSCRQHLSHHVVLHQGSLSRLCTD